MLETKKIKEVEQYAKNDVRYYYKELREAEEDKKIGLPAKLKTWQLSYPKGITSYYEEKIQQNNDRKNRYISQFGYTPETIEQRAEIYHEAFWSSQKWWQAKMVEDEATMAKYQPIFDKAEALAKKVDVSDIKDGFPCGMAVLYLKAEAKNTDLGKMLRRQYDGDSYSAKVCSWSAYKLPIKIPSYGQCMSYDERICEKVADFLNSKNIPTGVYSMID